MPSGNKYNVLLSFETQRFLSSPSNILIECNKSSNQLQNLIISFWDNQQPPGPITSDLSRTHAPLLHSNF